jgi:arylsulfatase
VAFVERTSAAEEGVLIAQGGRFGGYVLYVKDNRLHYEYNYLGIERFPVVSDRELPTGLIQARLDFIRTGEHRGVARLYAGDEPIGEGLIARTVPAFNVREPMDVGRDNFTPVSLAYDCPFAFSGILHKVEMVVGGTSIISDEQEFENVLATQ